MPWGGGFFQKNKVKTKIEMKNKFYIFAVAMVVAAVFSGCKKDKEPEWSVSINDASDIMMNSAKLSGTIYGSEVQEMGFFYDTASEMFNQQKVVVTSEMSSSNGQIDFSNVISNLAANTTYYYYAYATAYGKTKQSDVKTFKTKDSFSYDFESCTAFAIDKFPPCSTYDGDGFSTYGIEDAEFENSGYVGSFITFQNGIVDYFYSYRGTKFGCCMAAMNGANNDWFITPAINITEGMMFSFWARSVTDNYGLEQFKVGISSNRTTYSTYLAGSSSSSISAPTEWTQYTYDLSAYAGQTMYIAIMCVSNDVFALCIDDIYVGTNLNGKNMETDDRAELKQDSKSNIKKSSK